MPVPPSLANSPNISRGNIARSRLAQAAYAQQGNQVLNRGPQGAAAAKAAAWRARYSGKAGALLKPTAIPPAGAAGQLAKQAGRASSAGAASSWKALGSGAAAGKAALGAGAFGLGLGLGNWIYEDILGRPNGPSLGDHLRRQFGIEQDGPPEKYLALGDPVAKPGQTADARYKVHGRIERVYNSGNVGFLEYGYGPVIGPEPRDRGHKDYDSNGRERRWMGMWIEFRDGGYWIDYNRDDRHAYVVELGFSWRVQWVEYDRTDGTEEETSETGYGPAKIVDPLPPRRKLSPSSTTDPQPARSPRAANQPQTGLQYQPAAAFSPNPALPGLKPSRNPSTPAPATQPDAPTVEPQDPYPELRPEVPEKKLPAPALPNNPELIPRFRPTPTVLRRGGEIPQLPPATTKKDDRCKCNPSLLSGLARQIDPLEAALELLSDKCECEPCDLSPIMQKLLEMQTFSEIAWESTRVAKAIAVTTLSGVLHNSAMLSKSIGQTLSNITRSANSEIDVTDERGVPLDISLLVGTSVETFLQRIVGAEIYNDLSRDWKVKNRIVSAAAMVAYTARSLNDSSKNVLEWTAENTGKIGNALKRFGLVGEQSYPWMSERVQATDAYRSKFNRVTQGVDTLDELDSSFATVTSEILDITAEYNNLENQKTVFNTLVGNTPPEDLPTAAPENAPIATAEGQAKANNQSPSVAITDAVKEDRNA